MAKPFYKLRFELGELEITQEQLGKMMGRSQAYVGRRLAGTASWTLEDAYRILDIIGQPDTALMEYFPRHKQKKVYLHSRNAG